MAEPFKLTHGNLQRVIRLLQSYTSPEADLESPVNLDAEETRKHFALAARALNVDDDLGSKKTAEIHGSGGRTVDNDPLQGKQEVGDRKRASDSRSPTSPLSGCGEYTPRPVALGRDGSIISIDSLLTGQSAPNTGSDVTLDDIFARG